MSGKSCGSSEPALNRSHLCPSCSQANAGCILPNPSYSHPKPEFVVGPPFQASPAEAPGLQTIARTSALSYPQAKVGVLGGPRLALEHAYEPLQLPVLEAPRSPRSPDEAVSVAE